MDLHFLTFRDPFLLEAVETSLGLGLEASAGFRGSGAPRREDLLVFCNLYDSVIGPNLGGSVASLQDARQMVG